jgi:hypothetical protein
MMPDHLKAFASTGRPCRPARAPTCLDDPPDGLRSSLRCGSSPYRVASALREWDRGQDGIEVVPTGQTNPKFLRRNPLIERDFVTEISALHVSKSQVSKQPTHSQGLMNRFRPLDAAGLVRRLRDRGP